MCQIKFRIWDEKFKSWDRGGFYLYSDQEIKIQGRILTSFTGLQDKNRKEIYEGDIVLDKQGQTYQVKFNEDYGKFYMITCGQNKLSQTSYFTQLYQSSLIEVVGNIFENPELL